LRSSAKVVYSQILVGWWDGYSYEYTVIIDEFYSWLKYNFVLQLFDRYRLRVETKGCTLPFLSRRIILTSNTPVDRWYPNIEDKGALMRRITAVYQFPLETTPAWCFFTLDENKEN